MDTRLKRFVEKIMGFYHLGHLSVMRKANNSLCIQGIVCVGAKEFHPPIVNHLVSAFLGIISIKTAKGECIDLEIYSLILQLLHTRTMNIEIGVTFGMSQYDFVAFHLQLKNHLFIPLHWLMQMELYKNILPTNIKETWIIQSGIESRVNTVFATNASKLYLYPSLDGMMFKFLVATYYIVFVVGKARMLKVRGDNNLAVTHSSKRI